MKFLLFTILFSLCGFSHSVFNPPPKCFVTSKWDPHCYIQILCSDNSTIYYSNSSIVGSLTLNPDNNPPNHYLINYTLSNGQTALYNFTFPMAALCTITEATDPGYDFTVLFLLLMVVALIILLAALACLFYHYCRWWRKGSYTLPHEQRSIHLEI